MLWLLTSLALAQEAPCPEVGLAEIVAPAPPAVIVLGARPGTEPDLFRARRIAKRLDAAAEVTLALEVVPSDRQITLDRFADGEIALDTLPEALEWSDSMGGGWTGWRWHVSSVLQGFDVLAVGPDPGAPPSWQRVTVPRGYASHLTRGMPQGWEVHKSLEADFVRSVAWRQQQVAKQAVSNWSGRGYLVIVVDRPHATGLGVPWQVRQLTDASVSQVMLSWAAEPACEPTDRVWKRGLYDHAYALFGED